MYASPSILETGGPTLCTSNERVSYRIRLSTTRARPRCELFMRERREKYRGTFRRGASYGSFVQSSRREKRDGVLTRQCSVVFIGTKYIRGKKRVRRRKSSRISFSFLRSRLQ